MLRPRKNIFLVILFTVLLNECYACFRSNENQRISLTTGSSFYQECQCTEPGYTIEHIKWLDVNDQSIEGPGTDTMAYTEEQGDSISLHIPSISKSMSGTYKCVTEINGVKYTHSYTVDAYEPLYFFKTPIDQHLVLEHDSMINCEARGESLPMISWQKEIQDENYVDIPPRDNKYVIKTDGLLIKNVTREDAGIYKCTALVISTGEEVDKFITVDVQTVPVIEELQANPSSRVMMGDPLSIDCIAEGKPLPQYAWRKIGSNTNTTARWKQNFNTISFERVNPDDQGMYECRAFNDAGQNKYMINIEVLVPPVITYFPNMTEVEGTTIQLFCNATGRSDPNITIIYEGWDITSEWEESNYEIIPNMAFVNLDRSHEGIYVCNASNEVNSTAAAMYLTVLHRPYFKDDIHRETIWGYDGKTVKLNCAHDSNPPSRVTWRFESNDIPTEEQIDINKALIDHLNGMPEHYITLNVDKNTSYGMYTCTVKNSLGEATKVITLKEGFKPPVIKNATITDLTATTVTFDIEGPTKEDIPEILGYTAQYDEEKNYEITDIHVNRTWSIDRPYKIEKLKPNTTYYVSFAALNEVGAGETSEQLVFTTLEKSYPESPVLEEFLHRSSAGHLLKWKEADDNGEPIDYYLLKCCPVFDELNEELCEVRQVKATELELTDLESNTTYFLELIAHNAEGNSTPANISITIPALEDDVEFTPLLSGGAIIGISIVIVVLCLVLLDLLLLVWRRQGIVATCCINNDKKSKEDTLNSRDKKGLLGEPTDTRLDNGHREYEYNKTTGVVTGKHSAV